MAALLRVGSGSHGHTKLSRHMEALTLPGAMMTAGMLSIPTKSVMTEVITTEYKRAYLELIR